MDISETRLWVVRSTDPSLFLNNGIVAIGWHEMGDLSQITPNFESFKQKYVKTFPKSSKVAVGINSGQLYRFCHEAQIGDYVVFPSKPDRMIHIGEITGNYEYFPANIEHYPNRRSVKWIKEFPRTKFSQGALYAIGSQLTIFRVKNYVEEFLAAVEGKPLPVDDEDETVGATAEEIVESTKDFVLKELSHKLKGYDLEFFVANLLQAMGYRTNVSPKGGDSGIDITAYKDELPPRILVQVKSTDGDIKESTIQSLKGAMHEGDYGLFVTLSNYTKNAQTYLQHTPIIRGINGSELADLILKYYKDLDPKYQKMIPLKMVYIPVAAEE